MSLYRRLLRLSASSGGGDTPTNIDGYLAFFSDFTDTQQSNKYITTGGAISGYNGWNVSGWVEIPSDTQYAYCRGFDNRYTAFYNSSQTYMQHFADGAIPEGAKYVRVSATAATVAAGFVVFTKESK